MGTFPGAAIWNIFSPMHSLSIYCVPSTMCGPGITEMGKMWPLPSRPLGAMRKTDANVSE